MDNNSNPKTGEPVPLPNLKKVAKTKRGIAAIAMFAAYYIGRALDVIGWLQTVATLRPYLGQVSLVSTYAAEIGGWIGAHFGSIIVTSVSLGLFAWAAQDVAEKERQNPPANLILWSTTIRWVAIGSPPYNWETATDRSLNPQVALIARFVNRAKAIPVGDAENVRADIIFRAANGNHAASHPAPWLFCPSPIVSFAVGAT
ncbi:MAG TPA: hypothetical protein VMT58_08830, partial [Candidatus Binataceae bacterium]|nr:hypothetical protein [Candidatus Binataceae bacterium]